MFEVALFARNTQICCTKIFFFPNTRGKHSVSVIKTSHLMLYTEIIAVSSEIRIKHTNTLCGQNVELLNVKPGGTYSNHCALKD